MLDLLVQKQVAAYRTLTISDVEARRRWRHHSQARLIELLHDVDVAPPEVGRVVELIAPTADRFREVAALDTVVLLVCFAHVRPAAKRAEMLILFRLARRLQAQSYQDISILLYIVWIVRLRVRMSRCRVDLPAAANSDRHEAVEGGWRGKAHARELRQHFLAALGLLQARLRGVSPAGQGATARIAIAALASSPAVVVGIVAVLDQEQVVMGGKELRPSSSEGVRPIAVNF